MQIDSRDDALRSIRSDFSSKDEEKRDRNDGHNDDERKQDED